MSVLEITLLVIGLIAFFVSFFIPDKQTSDDLDLYTQDEIKNLIDLEIEKSKDRIASSTDETINYSIEKTERSLERISNEKILALGEYSDTILNQINKNHQEVVFLHDMLNKNKNDLTVLLGQAVSDSKLATETSKKAMENAQIAESMSDKAISNAKNAKEMVIFAEDKLITARKNVNSVLFENNNVTNNFDSSDNYSDVNIDDIVDINVVNNTEENVKKKTKTVKAKASTEKTTRRKPKVNSEPTLQDGVLVDNDGQISLKFDADEETSKNSNDKVLKLHKQGKSNVAIAKELGLGIGEVKLVIDLFKNKK